MSQHDFSITKADANTGLSVRAEINAALQALASNSSGPTEPPLTYANMFWYNSTTHKLMKRDEANTSWAEFAVTNASQLNGQPASYYAAANNAALTGIPTAPTAATSVNNNQLATTAFVQTLIASGVTAGSGIVHLGGTKKLQVGMATSGTVTFSEAFTNTPYVFLSAADGNPRYYGLSSRTTSGFTFTAWYHDFQAAIPNTFWFAIDLA